nr:MAG TPA: hypothetical protein [Caudoviricetes sp.]
MYRQKIKKTVGTLFARAAPTSGIEPLRCT